MTETQLSPTYPMEASETEHLRLIALAQRAAATVQEMCSRAGVGAGARIIDLGCGPIGALAEFSKIAGPQGTVVGVDSSADAVRTARAIVSRQGLANVRVVHGDVHTIDPTTITGDGSFDAAHLRSVLVHQPDPIATLRRAATLLRPAGKVLVADIVDDSQYPCFDPPLPAHAAAWELLYATARRRGTAVDVGRRLPRVCEAAGLRVLDARGSFRLDTSAKDWIESTRTVLQGARRAILGVGLASDADLDALAQALATAQEQQFRGVLGHLTVQVIAEVP